MTHDVEKRTPREVRSDVFAAVQGHCAVPGMNVYGGVILKPKMVEEVFCSASEAPAAAQHSLLLCFLPSETPHW
eukprot:CAMPEP_0114459888 /NCGR_PEP_ID=MMETSP0104-20121206/5447_1 /TAXON_ID=37642 ORGANISM="Paraphysomonas imperforata, Strain PA2" /NCGR_SAMPLE_ID=MMETSP0104 /ASSEMBLY_ACC=CAM_ASM_000202 /LENGTH=73 /DNA_ID=CAMNT_0001632553 /DNA_START=638 /DNA_END=859 /DNA_ORIENTATION=+